MLIAALVLGALAVGLARLVTLPGEAPAGALSERFGRELAGVLVFSVSTAAVGAGVIDVAARTPEVSPGIVLLGGWVLLRALTRKDASRDRFTGGTVAAFGGIVAGEAFAAWLGAHPS